MDHKSGVSIMWKKLLGLTCVLLALTGCAADNGLPQQIEPEIEKVLGMDVYIPRSERFPITYAEIRYPPELKGKKLGNRHEVFLSYSKEKGKLDELPTDKKKLLEVQGNRKFLYGPYEGKQVIHYQISNEHTSLANAKTREIAGTIAEYSLIERNDGKILFIGFNWKKGSYTFTFMLSDTFTEQEAFRFTENVITELLKASHQEKQ